MSSDQEKKHDVQPIIVIKKKKHVEEHAHSTAWKIALADFMTTLMIVFFVMWIINIVPPEKKKQLVSFFQGKKEAKGVGDNAMLPNTVIQKKQISNEMKVYLALEPELKKIDPSLKIFLSRGRLEINLNSYVLFSSGKPDLKSEFKEIIKKISAVIKDKKVYIDVYGYADSKPMINGTNLMLSTNRAQSVANEFIAQGISDNRLGVHGEGDRFPIAENSTEEGRSLNRRIVIYISPVRKSVGADDFTLKKNGELIPNNSLQNGSSAPKGNHNTPPKNALGGVAEPNTTNKLNVKPVKIELENSIVKDKAPI